MEKYGFLYVHRASPSMAYTVQSCGNKLYETMFQTVQAAVNFTSDEVDLSRDAKIAYFKILTNRETIKNCILLRGTVKKKIYPMLDLQRTTNSSYC